MEGDVGVLQDLDRQLSYGAFYGVIVVTTITWVLMILMWPRTRAEWAALSMLTGFNMFLWRLLWIAQTGNQALPQPQGLIFWVAVLFFVGVYFVDFVMNWGRFSLTWIRRRYRDRVRR